MTKRELESMAWKLGFVLWWCTKNDDNMWTARRRKTDVSGKTKRELEQFLIGVKVGKEMG